MGSLQPVLVAILFGMGIISQTLELGSLGFTLLSQRTCGDVGYIRSWRRQITWKNETRWRQSLASMSENWKQPILSIMNFFILTSGQNTDDWAG